MRPAPLPPARRPPVGWLAGAWALAVLGLLWAVTLSFASAMKTVPSMGLDYALAATPLPLSALALAGVVAMRVRRGRAPRSSLGWALPAFVAALLALLIGWGSYFGQP